jgi:DICT domain-containing protein
VAGWEQPGPDAPVGDGDHRRRFETIWTLDPEVTRRAARAAARLAAGIDERCGAELDAVLSERPLALEQPPPALTALVNRVVAYMEQEREREYDRRRQTAP